MNLTVITEIVFWLLLYLLIHTYIVYPLTINIISKFKPANKTSIKNNLPSISVIISAYNEEKVIERRIENLSKLHYDFEKVEVVIGSDCSTDNTNKILKEFQGQYKWLKSKVFDLRKGKASVLNELVKEAKNSILVFTDANTVFDQDALIELVKRYSDPKVGGVSGRLILSEPQNGFDKSNREKFYWEYETFLKKYEGKLGILIGANGGIFSIRKELFSELPPSKAVTDDLYITLDVLRKNYNFLFEYRAEASEEVSRDILSEFRRKIRFSATNFQTLIIFKELLFSKRILLAYAFWSHKVFRWLMPFVLIPLFVINLILNSVNVFYLYIFYIQLLVYFLSFLGYIFSLLKIRVPVLSLLFFFNLTNCALFIGFIKFLFGKHSYIWDSTPR